MRRVLVGCLLLVCLPWAGAQTRKSPSHKSAGEPAGPSREAADRTAIQKLQERDIAASMSFDPDALTALWTDDGILMIPGQAPIQGVDALRAFFEKQRDSMANVDVTAYEEEWQEVRIVGDYAFEWGQIHGRTRKGQGAAETSVTVNAMRVLKRLDTGEWRISRAIWNEARSGTSIGSQQVSPGERR